MHFFLSLLSDSSSPRLRPFLFQTFQTDTQPSARKVPISSIFFHSAYNWQPSGEAWGNCPRNTSNKDMSLAVTCNHGDAVTPSQPLWCIITAARDAAWLILIMYGNRAWSFYKLSAFHVWFLYVLI